MGMSPEFSTQTQNIGGGMNLIIEPSNNFSNISTNSVEFHEAVHAVVAEVTGTIATEATISPGPGFLGRTILSEANALAAVGPDAWGCDGTSHDRSIVHSLGHNPDSLALTARRIIRENICAIYSVASLLKERITIRGHEVDYAIDRSNTLDAKFKLIGETGTVSSFVGKVRRVGSYFIPYQVAALPQIA